MGNRISVGHVCRIARWLRLARRHYPESRLCEITPDKRRSREHLGRARLAPPKTIGTLADVQHPGLGLIPSDISPSRK
jgi:hypothetical protein